MPPIAAGGSVNCLGRVILPFLAVTPKTSTPRFREIVEYALNTKRVSVGYQCLYKRFRYFAAVGYAFSVARVFHVHYMPVA